MLIASQKQRHIVPRNNTREHTGLGADRPVPHRDKLGNSRVTTHRVVRAVHHDIQRLRQVRVGTHRRANSTHQHARNNPLADHIAHKNPELVVHLEQVVEVAADLLARLILRREINPGQLGGHLGQHPLLHRTRDTQGTLRATLPGLHLEQSRLLNRRSG